MTAIDRSVMRRPQWHWWVIIPPVLLAALLFGAAIGEVSIPPLVVLKVLANKALNAGYAVDKIDEGIVWNYRMARAVVAMCCGAGLALSGVVLQALLRNALADPYLLGISAGASTGAVAVTILGLGGGAISLSIGAFSGALVAFAFVALLAQAAGGGVGLRAAGVIVLAGIAGSQMFNALTALMITKSANAEQARAIMFWLLGNMSGVRWPDVLSALPAAMIGLLACLWHARALDAFTFGSDSAASLGIRVRRVQLLLIGTAALVTAVMVSVVGAIGFVGLVIPHAMRIVVGHRHAILVPASALAGAVFLVFADVISRVIVPGQVLPIGVVTALVGASVEGGMFFFLSHIMGKTLFFSTAGIVVYTTGIRDMRKLGGLARKMPVTATLWIIGCMMLSGFPPFSSFTAEWIMFTGVFERGLVDSPFSIVIAIGGLLAIMLTVAYSFGSARQIFFGPINPELQHRDLSDPSWTMTGPLFVVAGTSIVLGLYPRFVMDLFHRIIGGM